MGPDGHSIPFLQKRCPVTSFSGMASGSSGQGAYNAPHSPWFSDQPELARNPVADCQPFVGRESELRQLKAAFEAAAASGDGRLIMLVGEPGIGKTALCEQLSSVVSTRKGRVLVGHCYPEGSAGVPYQPFVEVFEAFARQHEAEALCAELGSNGKRGRAHGASSEKPTPGGAERT